MEVAVVCIVWRQATFIDIGWDINIVLGPGIYYAGVRTIVCIIDVGYGQVGHYHSRLFTLAAAGSYVKLKFVEKNEDGRDSIHHNMQN